MQVTVYLLTIKEPKEKISFLLEKCRYHFSKKDQLLILCPDLKAMQFVDDLLWNFEPSAFLPHGASPLDPIKIADEEESFSGKCLFNLKVEAPKNLSSYSIIYDFDDLTSKEKEAQSTLRFKEYKRQGCKIIC